MLSRYQISTFTFVEILKLGSVLASAICSSWSEAPWRLKVSQLVSFGNNMKEEDLREIEMAAFIEAFLLNVGEDDSEFLNHATTVVSFVADSCFLSET